MNNLIVNGFQTIGNYKLISVIGKGSFAIVYKGEKIENSGLTNDRNEEGGERRVKKSQSSEAIEVVENDNVLKKRNSGNCLTLGNANNKNEVYRTMPQLIAIKSIIKERMNRKLAVNLKLEINILREIQHKHIVQLYDTENSEKTINLLMEYCAEGDLSLYMKSHFNINNSDDPLIGPWKGFNEYVVLEFLFQLSSALRFMNENNIVHRDLKPQNILLTIDPKRRLHPIPRPTYSSPKTFCLIYLPFLKLADFGFARSLTSSDLASTLCGSPLYMAPEILDCKTYSSNVDLWSLGTILYELAISRTPYRAQNHVELLRKIKYSNGIYFPGEKKRKSNNNNNNNNNTNNNNNHTDTAITTNATNLQNAKMTAAETAAAAIYQHQHRHHRKKHQESLRKQLTSHENNGKNKNNSHGESGNSSSSSSCSSGYSRGGQADEEACCSSNGGSPNNSRLEDMVTLPPTSPTSSTSSPTHPASHLSKKGLKSKLRKDNNNVPDEVNNLSEESNDNHNFVKIDPENGNY